MVGLTLTPTLTLTLTPTLTLTLILNPNPNPNPNSIPNQNLAEKPTRAHTRLTLMNALDAWEADLPFAVSCLPAANHGLNYVRTAAEPCTAPNIDPRYVVAHQATCYPGEMHNVKDRTEFREI